MAFKSCSKFPRVFEETHSTVHYYTRCAGLALSLTLTTDWFITTVACSCLPGAVVLDHRLQKAAAELGERRDQRAVSGSAETNPGRSRLCVSQSSQPLKLKVEKRERNRETGESKP